MSCVKIEDRFLCRGKDREKTVVERSVIARKKKSIPGPRIKKNRRSSIPFYAHSARMRALRYHAGGANCSPC